MGEYKSKYFIYIYIIALIALGVGYISVLPVFEGLDETAHFSRIRETAYSKKIKYESSIDQSILKYTGPLPYSTGLPPFDNSNTYKKFFENPKNISEYEDKYVHSVLKKEFVSSDELNWQYQHPPLYYIIMSKIIFLTENLNFIDQFYVLRIVSYCFAILGIYFSIGIFFKKFINNFDLKNKKIFKLAILIYPILFPEFFYEFARIGNDSLCLMFTGLLILLVFNLDDDEINSKNIFFIGSVLGLGMITKALFLPIIFGIASYIFIKLFMENKLNRIYNVILFILPLLPVVIWYWLKYLQTGDYGGGFEAFQLSQGDGIINGFVKNFTWLGLSHGFLMPFVTFTWIGSWSVFRMPLYLYIFLIMCSGWIYSNIIIFYLKNIKINNIHMQVVWILLFMISGLFWHVIIMVALTGYGASGGNYLHILYPWLVPALYLGIKQIYNSNYQVFLLKLVLFFCLLFQILGYWYHIALFSGCAIKSDDKSIVFSEKLYCLTSFKRVIGNLDILAYPYLGLVSFGVGIILISLMIIFELRVNNDE